MQKFQHAHWLRTRHINLKQCKKVEFFLVQKVEIESSVQKVEINLIVSLGWVKGLSVE